MKMDMIFDGARRSVEAERSSSEPSRVIATTRPAGHILPLPAQAHADCARHCREDIIYGEMTPGALVRFSDNAEHAAYPEEIWEEYSWS